MTPTTFDVLVIGGGHNGLVAAAYLARTGRRVRVVEARDRFGGAVVGPWPQRSPTGGSSRPSAAEPSPVARSGVSRAWLYRLFPDKMSLIGAALLRGDEEFWAQARAWR